MPLSGEVHARPGQVSEHHLPVCPTCQMPLFAVQSYFAHLPHLASALQQRQLTRQSDMPAAAATPLLKRPFCGNTWSSVQRVLVKKQVPNKCNRAITGYFVHTFHPLLFSSSSAAATCSSGSSCSRTRGSGPKQERRGPPAWPCPSESPSESGLPLSP